MSNTNGSHPITPREAREQAAEATGFLAGITIKIGDEEFEVPQRGLMDDDQRERLDELELETESWDHNTITVDGKTVDSTLKVPYRIKGKLVKPSYPVRVAIALWGADKYERYKAGGGRAADVTGTLARLDRRVEDRARLEPKSDGGDSDVDAVPEPTGS